MAYYRLYTIGVDGRFRDVNTAECDSDDAACEMATAQLDGQIGIEIWQEARRVAVVTPAGVQVVTPLYQGNSLPSETPQQRS